jgi:hypothetical protein
VAALADGSLPSQRKPEVMRRLETSPRLQAALKRQRFAATTVRSVAQPAPATLRARVEDQSAASTSPRRLPRLGKLRVGVLAGSAAAAVLAVALLLAGRSGEPWVAQAIDFGGEPPEAGAPSADPDNPALLGQRGAGLPYPNLEPNFHWRASGVRSDELEGRRATTVFYEKDRRSVAYTITGGEPLAPPESRATVVNGIRFTTFRENGVSGVTWLRRGRTCILTSRTLDRRALLELAAWTGKGAVPT